MLICYLIGSGEIIRIGDITMQWKWSNIKKPLLWLNLVFWWQLVVCCIGFGFYFNDPLWIIGIPIPTIAGFIGFLLLGNFYTEE